MTLWGRYSGFRRIPGKAVVLLLLVLTIAFLWIASYINAISMLFVQNRTAASLREQDNICCSPCWSLPYFRLWRKRFCSGDTFSEVLRIKTWR